jgi:DoxX-like family
MTAGLIVLLLPWLPTLKELAYAGFTFTWIAATVAHYLAGDGALSLLAVALLGSLAVSYVTRPANRRGFAKSMLVQGDGSTPVPASGPYGGIGRGVEDLRAR